MISYPQTPPRFTLSDEQKQNIETLVIDVKTSIDTPLTEVDFSELKTEIVTALDDFTLTQTEIETIVTDFIDIADSIGITALEARTIFYDLQDIAQASKLPKTNDALVGSSSRDILWAGLGNDTLTGTDTNGVAEVDWLIGGGGRDTFVLGNTATTFYNDNNARTIGINDYAVIIDYNSTQDTLQLHGSASNYILGALPESSGMTGTGIFYLSQQGIPTPELVGVVAGVSITDFSSGFVFV